MTANPFSGKLLAVMLGGTAAERSISLESGENVAREREQVFGELDRAALGQTLGRAGVARAAGERQGQDQQGRGARAGEDGQIRSHASDGITGWHTWPGAVIPKG